MGILRSIDLKTSAVKQGIGLGLCIITSGHQILHDIIGKGIHKVCIYGVLFNLSIDDLDTGVDIICHGLIIFGLSDITLLQHIVQYLFATLGIIVRVGDRVELGRILGDTGNNGTFRKCQSVDRFVEITQGCCLYTKSILSKVNGVHIVDKDIILGHGLGQLNGKILLLDLTLDLIHEAIFLGPVGKYVIFQKLLGNGTGTFSKAESVADTYIGCADDSLDVNAIVFIKTFILDRDKSVGEILRDHILSHGNTIGILGDQFTDLVALQIINEGGKPGRCDINIFNTGSCINDPLKNTYPGTGTDDTDCQNAENHQVHDSKQ